MTTPLTLTGPDMCAQCGQEIDVQAVLAADNPADIVTPAYVTIRSHEIPVPGLYWDKACSNRINSGELESTLTMGAAQAFLDDIWGPELVGVGLMATLTGDDEAAEASARRLVDIIEVSHLLEAVTDALEGGDDLSWLPECDGKCAEHRDELATGQDKARAHLS